MSDNIIKQRALHKSNFTICHNEILFTKIQEKPVSLQALGLFWRIMSLPPNWQLNVKGLASISGCSKNKITACLEELKQAGYITLTKQTNEKGQIEGYNYYIYETTNEALWNEEQMEEIVNTKDQYVDNDFFTKPDPQNEDMEKPYPQKPDLEKPDLEKPDLENGHQYNIINNKELNIIKNTKNLSISKNQTIDKSIVTEGQFSNIKISKDKVTKTVLDKNNINLINLSCPKGSSFPKNKLPNAEQKKLARREAREQKNMEQPISNSIRTIDTQGYKKVGDLTSQDNELAQAIKFSKELTEVQKQVNKTQMNKVSRRNHIKKSLAKSGMDSQLIQCLSDYLDMYMDTKGLITNKALDLKIQELQKLSNNDVSKMCNLVTLATKNQWLNFYDTKDNKQVQTEISSSNLINTSQELKLAVDENGNPLMF